VSAATATAIALALASTVLTNLAYLREHDAAAALPCLTIRRPVHSARLLLNDRAWMVGFVMEGTGFLLYATALALASLALVQSILAGGIGVLAFVSSRLTPRRLSRRERNGAILSVLGLAALAVSLAGGSGEGSGGSVIAIFLWLGATAAVGAGVFSLGRRWLGAAVANGVAGGLFFSMGDISTKLATQGGARTGFVVVLILGYLLGTALLQLGYQSGGALTVAGLATLLTNALPIAAGTIVLGEPIPSGALGALRIFAFAAVSAGAFLLAQPDQPAGDQRKRRREESPTVPAEQVSAA
jgi:hypothetical protein